MELTNDNHLDVLGTANEKVAEQVGEGHDVEGRAPPTQQRHRGNGDETAQDCTQGVNAPCGKENLYSRIHRFLTALSRVKGGYESYLHETPLSACIKLTVTLVRDL